VREHRGGKWERLGENLCAVDLSADLQDYEERRAMDQEKLRTMIQFCQTTQCRTRYILEHFGEKVDSDWSCHNCDACDALESFAFSNSARMTSTETKHGAVIVAANG
jgi:ATP-dependent DNA helicase RecQ